MMRHTLMVLIATVFILPGCSKSTLNFLMSPPDSQSAPATYSFQVSPNEFEKYEWDFGDGLTGNDSTAAHRYYLSGNYMVTLRGYKGNKLKEVKKEILVTAPNKCLLRIETPHGDMIAELFEDTPKHRDNFVKLAEEGFYNDLLFHRVMSGFMIQGGDPNSRTAPAGAQLGSGGPGYQIDAEFSQKRAHIKGAIAGARTPDSVNPQRKSSGSQFYIVQGKSVSESEINQYEARLGITYPEELKQQYVEHGGVPFLDQQYTVFGHIIEGLEVIDRIAATTTNARDRPLENVSMKISLIK